MGTGYVKTGWITTVTPTMVAATLVKERERVAQSVAVDSGASAYVVGSLVLHYVRSTSRTPFAPWLYTDPACRWEALKAVYLNNFVSEQGVKSLSQLLPLPFVDRTEPSEAFISCSSSGKK